MYFSSTEPSLYNGIEPASVVRVCGCVRPLFQTLIYLRPADFNHDLSEASFGWGRAALGFWPDQIRPLVSMATDSPYRVIMGKTLWPL